MADDLNSETMLKLLKEKAIELKATQKKLKRVEEKFVDMHK